VGFTPLALEEWHSRHEHTVAANLADSSVPAIRLAELLPDAEALGRLGRLALDYPLSIGTARLRELIADWVGVDPSWVLVTVGAAEAVGNVVTSLVSAGDDVVVIEPGYRQVRGIATNLGARVNTVVVRPEDRWQLDLGQLDAAVDAGTRLIALNNPNNPLGTVFMPDEMDGIVRTAARHGAWLLADEVYRGSERTSDEVTPSFAGRYDKVVSVGSLSKSFGLPGLRIGWLAAPPDIVEAACRRHEYATIAASVVSMHLAEIAMEPHRRDALLARGRAHIRRGYERLRHWIELSAGLLSIVPPDATATAFVRYHVDVPSIDVAHAIRTEAGVLVGVGAHFGGEGHLRIGHTVGADRLDAAMPAIIAVLRRQEARVGNCER